MRSTHLIQEGEEGKQHKQEVEEDPKELEQPCKFQVVQYQVEHLIAFVEVNIHYIPGFDQGKQKQVEQEVQGVQRVEVVFLPL